MYHENKLIINLSRIKENYLYLKSISNSSEVSCVAKSDCYGLGMHKIAPSLYEVGCRKFFVMSLEEAINLKSVIKQDAEIYVLYGIFEGQLNDFLEHDLIPVINCDEQFDLIAKNHSGKPMKYAIHVDTGMNRLGFQMDKLASKFNSICKSNNLQLVLIMSHLAVSQKVEDEYNTIQLRKFMKVKDMFSRVFGGVKYSLANSGGIFLGDNYHFDVLRPGAALYGTICSDDRRTENIKNPIRYTSKIIQIFEINDSETVGYNRTYRASGNRLIASIPVGYSDKWPRYLSNKGYVSIASYKALIVGIISMNIITIDVTEILRDLIFLGQEVDLINDANTHNGVSEHGFSPYELITNFQYARFREYLE